MYQEIIEFWFKEINTSQWWTKDIVFDDLIRARFSQVHRRAVMCELFSWRECALGRLAEIIVLDQFSRNIYRDRAESFASDCVALALAQSAIADGHDLALDTVQRSFLYMPFMHSESLLIHHEATKLFTKLGVVSTLDFEMKHKSIIERFGRYPHRNQIVGRVSTVEEAAFLEKPRSGF